MLGTVSGIFKCSICGCYGDDDDDDDYQRYTSVAALAGSSRSCI